MRDLFDPSPEEQVVVLVERSTIREAEWLIESCGEVGVSKTPNRQSSALVVSDEDDRAEVPGFQMM